MKNQDFLNKMLSLATLNKTSEIFNKCVESLQNRINKQNNK